jgi:hypothetical protein
MMHHGKMVRQQCVLDKTHPALLFPEETLLLSFGCNAAHKKTKHANCYHLSRQQLTPPLL